MSRFLLPLTATGLLLAASIPNLSAKVALPPIFGPEMVLQCQMAVPVWGTANPGQKITVTFDKYTASATADGQGKWVAKLPAMEAGGPYTLKVEGEDTVTFDKVMVGEVWICAGQSNMELAVNKANNHDEEMAKAAYPNIRLFKVPHHVAPKPEATGAGTWVECSPQTIPEFTAVGYFFGRELHQKLKVPVGLIEAAWGGKLIENFMSDEALNSDPDFKPILDRYAEQVKIYSEDWADYDKGMMKLGKTWHEAQQKAHEDKTHVPDRIMLPPSGIYNGEIFPLASYAVRGAIWYQGESNSDRGVQYGKLLPAMIQDWRKLWGQGDAFAFVIVQLPNLGPLRPEPTAGGWPELRESQFKALSLPNTALTVTIDVGEEKNLHPTNKQDVGYRAGLQAEKLVYKLDVEAFGPVYKSMHVDGANVTVDFDHAEGLKTKDGGPVLAFDLAGSDQKFFRATGTVKGSSVVVHCDKVPAPVAVRYDWAGNPDGNLYNAAGLPARPFRTDDWPLATAKKL